jgi:hypothetical protein
MHHHLLSDICQILNTIAVLAASVVAICGIDSWVRKAHWKIRYNLAEEVLTLAYAVRGAIREIRIPLLREGEGSSRKKTDGESPEESKILDESYILSERYNRHSKSFNKIQVVKYRFMAVYGSEYENLFGKLNVLINEIFHANDMIYMYGGKSSRREEWSSEAEHRQHRDELLEHLKILYSGSKDDKFGQRVNAVIAEFETVCAPIIRKEQEERLGGFFGRIFGREKLN